MSQQSLEVALPQSTERKVSNSQPIWQLVILNLATLCLYQIYWFGRNWYQLKAHKKLSYRPAWMMVALFVPVIGLFLIYTQFKNIIAYAEEAGCEVNYSSGWLFGMWLVFSGLYQLPDPFSFLYFLTIAPIAMMQGVLNKYWGKEQPGLSMNIKFTVGQIVIVVLGGLFWLLVIAGSFFE